MAHTISVIFLYTIYLTLTITRAEEGCLCLEEVATGLKGPVYLNSPDDGSDRLFVTTQEGVIYIYAMDGTPDSEPFISLTERVTVEGSYHNGMVGMAFHPEFQTNKKFYVTYTALDNNDTLQYRLSEFSASSDDDKGNPDSERILISLQNHTGFHHAGQLFFGLDSYLYVFIGDGSGAQDRYGNAQNRGNLFGSILRIDVNTQNDSVPYGIPSDNPFVNEEGVRPEIYAYGFRNPFRGGQDKGDPDTGDGVGRIFCGDAGELSYEEINIVKAGHNYGWNFREGGDCIKQEICGGDYLGRLEEFPIYTYNRTGQAAAVIGGTVYRGCRNPELNGLYFYSDYGLGSVNALKEHAEVSDYWENIELGFCPTDECPDGMKGTTGMFTRSFGEDSHGELYLLTSDSFSSVDPMGKIHRLVDPRKHADLTKCYASETSGTDSTLHRGSKLCLFASAIAWILILANSYRRCGSF